MGSGGWLEYAWKLNPNDRVQLPGATLVVKSVVPVGEGYPSQVKITGTRIDHATGQELDGMVISDKWQIYRINEDI